MIRSLSALVMSALIVACGGAAAPTAAPVTSSAATASPSGALAAIRARGTLVVSIRMDVPPTGKPNDPAHSLKRAFEAAVASLVAQRVIGTAAKVDFKSVGQDRTGPVTRGEADAAMTVRADPDPAGLAFSKPYAGAAIVFAAPPGSAVKKVEDLAGKTIAVATDELGAQAAAEKYLKARNITATLVSTQGVRGAADAVAAGTAAALVGDSLGVAVTVKDKPGSLQVIAEAERRTYVIAVSASAADLLAEVDKAIAALIADGSIVKAATSASFPYEEPR